MNIIKVRYIKDGEPRGKEYSYKSELDLPIGLRTYVPVRKTKSEVVITDVITPDLATFESELRSFEALGFTMEQVVEIKADDLLVTLIKHQEL